MIVPKVVGVNDSSTADSMRAAGADRIGRLIVDHFRECIRQIEQQAGSEALSQRGLHTVVVRVGCIRQEYGSAELPVGAEPGRHCVLLDSAGEISCSVLAEIGAGQGGIDDGDKLSRRSRLILYLRTAVARSICAAVFSSVPATTAICSLASSQRCCSMASRIPGSVFTP